MNQEIQKLATQWTERTVEALKTSMTKLKVGKSGELKLSIKGISNVTEENVSIKIEMQLKGRFVDGGAGRGQPMNTKRTARKAKKFYSRTFYGRLSGLRGAVSFQYAQEIKRVIQQIE